jgi:hypothetical protein
MVIHRHGHCDMDPYRNAYSDVDGHNKTDPFAPSAGRFLDFSERLSAGLRQPARLCPDPSIQLGHLQPEGLQFGGGVGEGVEGRADIRRAIRGRALGRDEQI